MVADKVGKAGAPDAREARVLPPKRLAWDENRVKRTSTRLCVFKSPLRYAGKYCQAVPYLSHGIYTRLYGTQQLAQSGDMGDII